MKKLDCKGMTLIEVVVSIAILSIISVGMIYGFLTAATVLRRGIDIRRRAEDLTAQVEALEEPTGSGTVTVGGVTRNVDVYSAAQDGDTYSRFRLQ